MAESRFSRTELLLGQDSIQKLSEKRVAVFGIGGVGGYVTEALARSGERDFRLLAGITLFVVVLRSRDGRPETIFFVKSLDGQLSAVVGHVENIADIVDSLSGQIMRRALRIKHHV